MEKYLNILYVGLLPPHPGGAPISCTLLLSGFAELGNRVRALAPITEEALKDGEKFSKKHKNIEIHRYLVPYNATNPTMIPPGEDYVNHERQTLTAKLIALINTEYPHVILIGRESFAMYVPTVANRYGIPCILMIRGAVAGMMNGYYPRPLVTEYLRQFKKVDLIVSVAQHFSISLRKQGIDRIKTIPNGVDVKHFSPAPTNRSLERDLDIQTTDIVILYPALLKAVKRPFDVINAAEQALMENSDLMFLVAGIGQRSAEMKSLCDFKKIDHRFRFLGWIDNNRMPEYYNLADIVVLPSEHEGLARVYLEAQSCACALLASDIPAAREVISHGETGLLFNLGDIDDLKQKILVTATDRELRTQLGRKAREYVVRKHDIHKTISTYLSEINKLLRE